MNLHNYLARLEAIIHSRQDIEVEYLFTVQTSESKGAIRAKLLFYNGSFLDFAEQLRLRGRTVFRVNYTYHYQQGERCIFRYDNAPHHAGLDGFPNHKHMGDEVIPADPPDLNDIIGEIDAILYPTQASN